jgi:hypothetical protein
MLERVERERVRGAGEVGSGEKGEALIFFKFAFF